MRTLSEIWLVLCRRLMRCSSATNTRKLYSPLTEKLQDTELCMPVWMTSMMSPFLPIHPKHCGATVFRKGYPALQATVRKPDVPSHHNIKSCMRMSGIWMLVQVRAHVPHLQERVPAKQGRGEHGHPQYTQHQHVHALL